MKWMGVFVCYLLLLMGYDIRSKRLSHRSSRAQSTYRSAKPFEIVSESCKNPHQNVTAPPITQLRFFWDKFKPFFLSTPDSGIKTVRTPHYFKGLYEMYISKTYFH